jgi:hypothetical protein
MENTHAEKIRGGFGQTHVKGNLFGVDSVHCQKPPPFGLLITTTLAGLAIQ